MNTLYFVSTFVMFVLMIVVLTIITSEHDD
jgi:hypothetical protein